MMASGTKSHSMVAARIAGEDIEPGDFITVLNEFIELPSFLWCGSGFTLPPNEPVRTRRLPQDAGRPHKVFAVCLPYVYANDPDERLVVFDTSRQQLVRLGRGTGRRIWRRMRHSLTSKSGEVNQ
jgi:hypothetical protein